jgi:hypothetical protein
MRYSRFKKQIEGPSAVRKPRNPSSPRKSKVEKNKSPKKIKERQQSAEEDKIKTEAGEAGAGRYSVEGTPEAGAQESSQHTSPIVKREPGLPGGYPLTPVGSQTPSPRYDGNMSEMDEMVMSFGMPGGMAGEQGMYPGVNVMDGGHGYGMGMQMGLADPFDNLWQPHAHAHAHAHTHGPGAGLVKSEPSWEGSYPQI